MGTERNKVVSKPIKKCSICHKKFEQPFRTSIPILELYNHKQTLIAVELLNPYAPKEFHQEITFVQQEASALDKKTKPSRKELAVLLENFYQSKLNKSFIESAINYLEKGDESKIEICKLCGQEVEQQEKVIVKKLKEIEKDTPAKLRDKCNHIYEEIEKKIGQEKLEPIFSKVDEKCKKEILAELKSFLEKPSEFTQQDSKPQSNQPKPTNHTP